MTQVRIRETSMYRWLFVLAFAFGCNAPTTDTSVDTDTDSDTDTVVDTDVDTDGDTFTIDTSWGTTDTDTDAVDTDNPFDTADTVDDTAMCKFGEIEDCNGDCYPEYFKGDGYCDDGTTLPADFDCAVHDFDNGDCEIDTDTPTEGCQLNFTFVSVGSGGEISWRIVEAGQASNLYSVATGTYSSNNTYTQTLYLPDGQYQVIGADSAGDGWEGGYWTLTYESTGQLVAEGRDFTGGSSRSWLFTVNCSATGCGIDLVTKPGTDPQDMGWELYTTGGRSTTSLLAGTLPAGSTTPDVRNAAVFDGSYTLRLRDAHLDGWKGGGLVEARTTGGYLIGARGLSAGGAGAMALTVDCDLDAEVAFDDPGPPIMPTDCGRIAFEMLSVQPAIQISYTLYKVDGWTTVLNKPIGSFQDNSSRIDNTAFPTSGRYFIEMKDNGGDGWGGSRLRIRDGVTNQTMLTTTMPNGNLSGKYVDVVCPTIVDTDTDLPVDTDTDVPMPTCLAGAEPDCDGICFPTAFVGDGHCDNGTLFTANFDCPRFGRDGGDCATP